MGAQQLGGSDREHRKGSAELVSIVGGENLVSRCSANRDRLDVYSKRPQSPDFAKDEGVRGRWILGGEIDNRRRKPCACWMRRIFHLGAVLEDGATDVERLDPESAIL